jgi:acetone carboxylase gamma subunit
VTCHAGDLSAIHNHDFFTLVFRSFQSQQRISKNPTCSTYTQDGFFIMAEVFPHAKLAGCPWMTYLFFWCPDLWKPICK